MAMAIASTIEERFHDEYTRDERDLVRLGKVPVLKRTFSFMQILGFSCTVLETWVAIFCWVAMLFITGWVSLIGWQATTASLAYFCGNILQSIILILHDDYSPKPYQAMLLEWSVIAFSVFINTIGSKTLAHFEGLVLILHILGFFAILIPMVYLSRHSDTSIFTTFINSGGWPTQGLSFMVGLPSLAFTIIGVDSCIHMSEEVKNASKVVPRAILISVFLNGALGLAMTVAYLFCLGDLQDLLDNSAKLGYAFLYVFLKGTGSPGGAITMALVIWVLGICCLVGVMAATSRQMWSFARDNAVPFSAQFTKLHPQTLIPVNTIWITALVSALLSFIALDSYVAFNNIVNLSIGGLYASYFIVCVLLLWRRLQGIRPYNANAAMVGPESLQWGPWKVPGMLGVVNNLFACAYILVLWFFSFWPGSAKVNAETMNFSSVTFGGTVIFAIVWYYMRGRKTYRGPIIEVVL
ncbi:amino acid/polyamine transporter I [Phaeosphaeriaceae sp. PMI808]|nr:amino acid/polyamine transporter I [Phaeosphaeriaceae sp. PMI808]